MSAKQINLKYTYHLADHIIAGSYITSGILTLGSLALAIFAWTSKFMTWDERLIFTAIAITFLIIAALAVLSCKKIGITISDDGIESLGIFKNEYIPYSYILGYRLKEKYIHFEGINEQGKPAKISINSYYAGYDQIHAWTLNNFEDLDKAQSEEEHIEIQFSSPSGTSGEERLETAKRWKYLIRGLSILSWAVILTLYFKPNFYYSIFISLCSLIPLVGLMITFISRGLVRIYVGKDSPYASIENILFFPSCILLIRSLTDHDILDYSNFWMPLGTAALTLSIVLIYKEWKHIKVLSERMWILGYIALFSVAYPFSMITVYNDLLDHATPQVVRSIVLDKEEVRGKRVSYRLNIAHWEDNQEALTRDINKETYDKINKGDSITIRLYRGKFNIPYYHINVE